MLPGGCGPLLLLCPADKDLNDLAAVSISRNVAANIRTCGQKRLNGANHSKVLVAQCPPPSLPRQCLEAAKFWLAKPKPESGRGALAVGGARSHARPGTTPSPAACGHP
jgi:hypothetical protein